MDAYMLKKIYDIFEIPVYVAKDGKKAFCLPESDMYQSPFERDSEFLKGMLELAKKQEKPYLYLEDGMIYYGVFHDKEENYYLFGPMARKTLEQRVIDEYRHTHRIQLSFQIDKYGMGAASKMIAMAFYYFTGKEVEHQDIWIENPSNIVKQWNTEGDMEYYQLEQSEEERHHNSIDYENRIMQIVRNGDVAAMKELMNTDRLDMDDVGVVAIDNQKQTEYLMVTFIALITRAAIDGGLNPERAYELGDIYLQQIEKCKSVVELNLVGVKAQMDITEQVCEAKKRRSKLIYIEECKDYIAKNLRKPFQVGDIAPAIGVNRTYLARKFVEIEGMTIQQYIMQERCKHAANLLKYSKYPLSIISEYFCFSSQSHFGVQFKKYYGMTPNEYRNQNRYIESYNNKKDK